MKEWRLHAWIRDCDNEDVIYTSPYVHEARIAEVVQKVTPKLAADVVRIRFSIAEDWSGTDAVFFRVVLRDEATVGTRLRATAKRVEETVLGEIDPPSLGLQYYFWFRAESEQAEMKDASWE